jgi:hypothetical protein
MRMIVLSPSFGARVHRARRGKYRPRLKQVASWDLGRSLATKLGQPPKVDGSRALTADRGKGG